MSNTTLPSETIKHLHDALAATEARISELRNKTDLPEGVTTWVVDIAKETPGGSGVFQQLDTDFSLGLKRDGTLRNATIIDDNDVWFAPTWRNGDSPEVIKRELKKTVTFKFKAHGWVPVDVRELTPREFFKEVADTLQGWIDTTKETLKKLDR